MCTVGGAKPVRFQCHVSLLGVLIVATLAGTESPRSLTESLPLAVAKEAKVSDMEDDQLGDEDLNYLDNQ